MALLVQASGLVKISRDLVSAEFTGSSNHSLDEGVVQGSEPLPHNVDASYFEIFVHGQDPVDCSVGVATRDTCSQAVGSFALSFGYRSVDGKKCGDSPRSTGWDSFGSAWGGGDTIG